MSERPFALGTVSLLAAICMVGSGCLSDMHRIPKDDLMVLSQMPPEQRGKRVRVIQGFAGEEAPPEAPHVTSSTTVVGVVVVDGGGGYRGGRAVSRGRPSNLAASKANESKYWLIIAGLLAVGLAATEGARYDGWVEVNPMHPVHVWGPYGEYSYIPLAQIDPETAAWAAKALIRPAEGPWTPLGRAPLNRVGFTYALTLGAAEIPSAAEKQANGGKDTGEAGFIGHIGFGYFPAPVIGILIDIGLGWRQNDFNKTVFDARNSLELQFLPLAASIFHAGFFGDVGIALRLEDGARGKDKQSFYGEAGLLMQLELTTRLALQARAGVGYMFGELISEGALGVAIY